MVSSNLIKAIEAAAVLNEAEREELRRRLDQRDGARTQVTKEEQARLTLIAQGLLSHVPSRAKDIERFRRWQLIPIRGKPLSETIIEERR